MDPKQKTEKVVRPKRHRGASVQAPHRCHRFEPPVSPVRNPVSATGKREHDDGPIPISEWDQRGDGGLGKEAMPGYELAGGVETPDRSIISANENFLSGHLRGRGVCGLTKNHAGRNQQKKNERCDAGHLSPSFAGGCPAKLCPITLGRLGTLK